MTGVGNIFQAIESEFQSRRGMLKTPRSSFLLGVLGAELSRGQ
jgi:hypothetical protein